MARRSRRTDDTPEGMSADDKVLLEAKDRFKRAQEWETTFRRLFVVDSKFAYGDSDNGWQWPDDVRRDREINKRPALTIPIIQTHLNLIKNDARQNKPSIKISPTNSEASFESAQVYEGLIRDIEYKSHAQDIYDDVGDDQVDGGIGYCRLEQYYPDEDSFNQALRIAPVPNALSVYLDCDIKLKDGSDAKWGFIFDETPRKEFEREYPDVDLEVISNGVFFDSNDDWVRQDYVRQAEYYRLVFKKDTLYWVRNAQGEETTFLESQAPKGFKDSLELPGTDFKTREVKTKQLEWYKIAGHQIIRRDTERKGNYIPIARAVGIEKVISGQLERKGFVRTLKDSQRMYNYNASGAVEFGALQSKTPWVGAAAAFEGNEVAWNNANLNNAAYLTFKHLDSEGNPLPPNALPQRIEPPATAPVFMQGMQDAVGQMQLITGQFAAQQGQPGNEKSGRAIQEHQRQSDIATYLFVNNLAIMIRHLGRMIVDLVPHIYDTKQVIQILGKDGSQTMVQLNPDQDDAYSATTVEGVEQVLFNPTVGKYEVQADIGPAYSTQRQEAYNAFVQIITGAPALIDEIGDLMFRSADFPLADKIAERLRRKIEANAPYLLKDGVASPQMQQMQVALTQAQGQIGELIQKLAEKNLELKDKQEDRNIRSYEAEGKRLVDEATVYEKLHSSQVQMQELLLSITETLHGMRQDSGQPSGAATTEQGEIGEGDGSLPLVEGNDIPPFEGAEKAPDGAWYMPDSSRPGKYLQVGSS
jgi:Phage P22-like portal protein